MAPPGTRAVIYLDSDSCTSWGALDIDTWYCILSPNNYRNCIFYVPERIPYRISDSSELFSQHCLLPQFTPVQKCYRSAIGIERLYPEIK